MNSGLEDGWKDGSARKVWLYVVTYEERKPITLQPTNPRGWRVLLTGVGEGEQRRNQCLIT